MSKCRFKPGDLVACYVTSLIKPSLPVVPEIKGILAKEKRYKSPHNGNWINKFEVLCDGRMFTINTSLFTIVKIG